jgi:hypothetical protein
MWWKCRSRPARQCDRHVGRAHRTHSRLRAAVRRPHEPVVTLAAAATAGLRWHSVPAYIVAQITGGILGVWLAHAMFDLPIWQLSQHVRTGPPQWLAETISAFGLLLVIWGCRAHREPVTAFAVAAYITGAYWFTASTSFANPAVTIARSLTDTFAGIRPRCAGLCSCAIRGLGLGAADAAPVPSFSLMAPQPLASGKKRGSPLIL